MPSCAPEGHPSFTAKKACSPESNLTTGQTLFLLYPPRRCCAVSIFPHIHGVRNARPDVSGTFIFAFAAPAVNDSELDKRGVLCYTENAINPTIARFLRR